MGRELILEGSVARRSLRNVSKLLSTRADGLLQRAPVGRTLKALTHTELARTCMLDWKTIRSSFCEVTSPLGSTTLIASTILEPRTRPRGLDPVFKGTYQVHLSSCSEGRKMVLGRGASEALCPGGRRKCAFLSCQGRNEMRWYLVSGLVAGN